MMEGKEETAQEIYFVRHAESEYNAASNKGQAYVGANPYDTPLSPKGQKQANRLAQTHKLYLQCNSFYHTGLARTKQTLEPLQLQFPNVPVFSVEDLKEHNWGALEGKVLDYHQISNDWKAGKTPEGGESYEEFQIRIKRGIQKILLGPKPALVVAHGGVIRCILDMLKRPQRNISNVQVVICPVHELLLI